MVAKIWKKLLLFILIVACLFNIVTKIVKKNSLNEELRSSAQYILDEKNFTRKLEIVFYLEKKTKIFFDKSGVLKSELTKLCIEPL